MRLKRWVEEMKQNRYHQFVEGLLTRNAKIPDI